MDTLRGTFSDDADFDGDVELYGPVEDEPGRESPPAAIGHDERRMQVRAYNHWASLLGDRTFPSITDLDPENLPDFGPYSVLLDFTSGVENPGISFLGEKLAEECSTDENITELSAIPSRSLLSRITDHYMQILANQAPIGFEAEFVNQKGLTILYRGILLPFSSNDTVIDFIYGVINWKELADQFTTDELLLEIDQALDEETQQTRPHQEVAPLTNWADGPATGTTESDREDILDLTALADADGLDDSLPEPAFGVGDWPALDPRQATGNVAVETAKKDHAAFAPEPAHAAMGLGDWLAQARELAELARNSEDRSRQALYAAIGRAYDFSIAAIQEPEEFAELVADSGLTMQDRAPMTPVVKLVFGADYDKTRLTEYAAALNHGHRLGISQGEMEAFLSAAEGGLKAVVAAERRLRREESGKAAEPAETPHAKLARKLGKLEPHGFDAIDHQGHEFALVMIRRLATGEIVMLGEVPEDIPLLEKAARKLVG